MNQEHIDDALVFLSRQDQALAEAYQQYGSPAPRIRENSLETLLSIIVSQQISTDAARAIMGRVKTLLPEINGQTLVEIDKQALRSAGLSWRKIDYVKGVGQAALDGQLMIEAFEQQSDEQVISSITALKGFGRWSADIYLMFALQRQDVFPADDLALVTALAKLKGLTARPSPAEARALIEHWSPYRSAGSLFLWHYYRGAPN